MKDTSVCTNKVFDNYLGGLKEEIENLPKPKYYDESIRDLRKDVKKDVSRLEKDMPRYAGL